MADLPPLPRSSASRTARLPSTTIVLQDEATKAQSFGGLPNFVDRVRN